MVDALGTAPLGAIGGVLVGLLVVAALIYAAVSQYGASQRAIANKHQLAQVEAARASEQTLRDAQRAAGLSRLTFESQRARIKSDRAGLVAASRSLLAGARSAGWDETTLLVPDRWLVTHPLHLDPDGEEIGVNLAGAGGQGLAAGLQDALRAARPLTTEGVPFGSIVDGILEIEAPAAWRYVNRDCYRVLGLTVEGGRLGLEVGHTSYFAALEEAIPLECEIAGASIAREGDQPAGGALPVRAAIGDPFLLSSRTAVASVSTLVLRRAAHGPAEFWLHRRRTVGMVGGQTHVVPTGVFQPAVDDLPDVFVRDAQPWFTVVREFAEELLGVWDADSRAVRLDAYGSTEPFAIIEAARRDGTMRPWFVGAGLDPLSYWVELLTVLVVDEAEFDAIVGDPPRENKEGSIVGRTRPDGSHGGHPFTQATVDEILASELAPAADALLRLAWQHREALLADA